MSDDLNKKIKQITDILGQEKVPDNLMGLLSLLTSSGNNEEAAPSQESNPSSRELVALSPKEEKSCKNELEDNVDMIRKAKKMMDKIGGVHNNDPRVNLLTAVRPFLNNSRQRKVGHCIKMLSMSKLTRLMDEKD